jgi:ribosomal protein L11 methyltransferase
MASSPGSEGWVAASFTVAEAQADLASYVLVRAGAEGIVEDHPGLHFGEDGPLLSGDPEDWRPPVPVAPDGRVRLCGYLQAADGETLAALLDGIRSDLVDLGIDASDAAIAAVPEHDWNARWKAAWRPFRLSPRIWITPSWEAATACEPGMREVRLDPGMAFGTGTHATTSLCAEALDELLAERAGLSVLDLGTGTGILAMAARVLGAGRVCAVDLDPQAVACAAENVERNSLSDIEVGLGSAEQTGGSFDIVVANLLAPVLLRIAQPLAARLGPGGVLLWSGVLPHQADEVEQAFLAQGLPPGGRWQRDGWVLGRAGRT